MPRGGSPSGNSDGDGKVVWEYVTGQFMNTRLRNGHTLIGNGSGHNVLEVNSAGEIVWSLSQRELPGIEPLGHHCGGITRSLHDR